MSRIRIYELAKEAGLSGKEFAEKLIKKGYQIKGHSSTVDNSTAEEIRRTFLGNNESGEGNVQKTDDTNSAIQRRTTVIRRKKTEEPETASTEPEEKVAVVIRKTVVAEPKKNATVSSFRQAGEEDQLANLFKDSAAGQSTKNEETDVASSKNNADAVEQAGDGTTQPTRTMRVEPNGNKVAERKMPKSEDSKLPPRRSGAARVVGRVELPKEEVVEPARPRRKPNKPINKPPTSRPSRPNEAGPSSRTPNIPNADVAGPVSGDDARNKKKKGRRGEQVDEDRESRGKGKKGKVGVKFTHFGNDYQARGGKRGRKNRRDIPANPPPSEMKASKKKIKVYDTITVGELASRMKVKAGDVIGKLMSLGVMATINQTVDTETAMVLAEEYGYEVEQGITEEIGIQLLSESEGEGEGKPRSPVVTVMGHVDHGKTSILDAIRKTDVADGEAGGITQHIGAYHVRASSGDVTFVDTPGHAAFTEMRSRGAQITDVVILVVAADDGVMDQTREAIRHAQAANVPIIVAVNKIDKDNADVDRVKRELAELDLAPEEWGGQTMYYETSAKQQIGIDELMEGIQLLAEVLELKADPDRKAMGRVIEAQLDKGRGPVATILIQAGTLRLGDYFVVGQHSGKVRAMLDYKGRNIVEAGPSIPVEVHGLSGVPSAGDEFVVVTDEKMAKSVSQVRAIKAREVELGATSKISLDKLFEQMSEGDVQELRVVLRADVQGTLEAFAKATADLSTKEIKVRILHEGTGTITGSDILLASASDAIIIGFNVRPTAKVKELAVKESVDVRSYDVIYHALDDIRNAMVGMLDPTFEEEIIGDAEVRDIFSVPKIGVIGGCAVLHGKIQRNAGVRVIREGVVVYTGKIDSLRRFKDDVKEVATGYECGIGVENFNDIKVGDVLEAFVMKEVEGTLSE